LIFFMIQVEGLESVKTKQNIAYICFALLSTRLVFQLLRNKVKQSK
jgi:hypothetical protein